MNAYSTSSITQSWRVFSISALLVCYIMSQMAALNSLGPHLIAKFSLNAQQLSQVSTAYLYACIIAVIPAGYLIDKFGIYKPSLFAIGINIIGIFLLITANNFALLWLSRFLCGLGNSVAILAPLRIASTQFPTKLQALVKGLTFTAAMLGGALAQGPFVLLMEHSNLKQLLYWDLSIGILIFILVSIFISEPNNIREQQKNAPKIALIPSLFNIIKNSGNWLCAIYTGLANLALFILGTLWGNLYLQQVHGLTVVTAAYISSFVFYGIIIGSPLLGWAANLLKSRLLLMKLCGVASVISLMVLLYTEPSIYLIAFLFLMLGIANGGQLLGYITIAESNDPKLESIASGFVSLMINIIGALFQLGFGWLIQSHWDGVMKNNSPWYSIGSYHIAFNGMIFLFLLSFIIPFFMRETFGKKI